ncbi:MAG TPA: DUF3106 domain-containing protein, partial [Burkholderiaceae bacterium]|nr:DUF3106 domain-containing protein [Burkholderiaceae bacterium]
PASPAPDPAAAAPAPRAEPAPRPPQRRTEPRRPSLLPLAQPLWSELAPTQQQVLEPFSRQWNALPVAEKLAWADLAKRFPSMQPDEQARVQRRIAEWAALTPEDRRLARANYRLAQQAAREHVIAEWENYQSLTADQRTVLNAVGSTSNTAARHVAARNGLARIAAQPLPRFAPQPPTLGGASAIVPARDPAGGGAR